MSIASQASQSVPGVLVALLRPGETGIAQSASVSFSVLLSRAEVLGVVPLVSAP